MAKKGKIKKVREINKIKEIKQEKEPEEKLTLDEIFEEEFDTNESNFQPTTSEFKTDLFLKSDETQEQPEDLEQSIKDAPGGEDEEKTENPYELGTENPYELGAENLYELDQDPVYQQAEEREGVSSTGRESTSLAESITPTISGTERSIGMQRTGSSRKKRESGKYNLKREDQVLSRNSRLPEEMRTAEYKTTI